MEIKTTGNSGGVTRDIYGLLWGNAPSSVAFNAQANDLGELVAGVQAMTAAAR